MKFQRAWSFAATVAVATVLAGRPVAGACYSASPPMNSICATAYYDSDYVTFGTYLNATVNVSSKSYVLDMHYNSLDVWDSTDPSNPRPLTSSAVHVPWTLGGEGTGGPLTPHLRQIATLDGFPYALASLYTYGWDYFEVDTQQFLSIGYNPGTALKSYYYRGSALFRAGNGDVFAAGQKLDAKAISDSDASVYLYWLQGAGSSTPPPSFAAMTSRRYRVPVGGANDGAYSGFSLGSGGTLAYFTLTLAGKTYLLVSNGYQAVVVNVTNPSAIPLPVVAMWTGSTAANLFAGPWAIDTVHAVLHAADPKTETVYSFDISNLTNPVPVATTIWSAPLYVGVTRPGLTVISTTGGAVVVVGIGQYLGYIPIGSNGLPGPPLALDTNPQPGNATYIDPLQCVHPTLHPGVMGLSAFTTPSGQSCVARALYSWGDIITVAPACLSTLPAPAFTVTATTPTASGAAPSTANCSPSTTNPLAAQGFPGDTFTISDGSTGSIATGDLVITPTTSGTQSWHETGSNAWQPPPPLAWQSPPSGPPGEYQVAMTLHDASGTSYPLTKSIFLCSTPKAAVQITAVNGTPCGGPSCVYLANDTVTFSAAPGVSDGTPTNWQWYQTASVGVTNLTSCDGAATCIWTVPSSGGPYTVAVAAIYGFPGSVDSSCANLTVNNSGDWASCATSGPVTPTSFAVGNVTASQTGSVYPNFVSSLPITVKATYAVASGFTANFVWAQDNVSGRPSATPATQAGRFTGDVTGTISSLPAGSHTVALGASATDGTNVVTPVPAPVPANFVVTTCSNGAPVNPYPPDGAVVAPGSVTLSWSPASGASPQPTYTVNWGIFHFAVPAGDSSYVVTTSGGQPYPWSVTATNSCGSVTSPTWGFTTSSPPPPPPTPTPAAGPTASFRYTPALPQANQPIQFTDTSSGSPVRWNWDFGDGTPFLAGTKSTSQNPSFAYKAAGSYTVTLTVADSGGNSSSTYKQVTVAAPCTAQTPPTAAFAFSPNPGRMGQAVQFSDTSTGGPTSWSWNFGDGVPPLIGAHTSNLQNPINVFSKANTYVVTLTATNCAGSSTTTQQITVGSACDQTAAPTASFTWPTGPVDGFPEQQQPYAGQQITLTAAFGTSAGEPTSWHWYDFNELGMNQTVTTPTFTFTWPANLPPGAKNVRMTATNCFGTSAEVVNVVTIYPDVRHVVADFTWTTGTLATGSPVTLVAAQGPSYGDPDQFTWRFDDGSPQQSGASITHTFGCAGTRTVTLTVGRSDYPAATATASHALALNGQQCGPESVMTVDAAQLPGVNDTYWRTNVRLFNSSSKTSQITVEFRPIGWGNNTAGATVPVNPYATLVLDDIIAWGHQQGLFGTDVKKAALRILYSNADNVAPVVTSETFTSPPAGGGTYGQLGPGIEVVPNSTAPTLWITGIRNNGPTTGFRTNYSLLNLRNTAVSNLVLTLLDPAGQTLATQSVNLGAYEYRQDSLAKLFGNNPAAISPNPLAVKVAVPDGSDIQAYTSVVDNLTGDPVLIPAVPPPSAPIFLPAVAYTPGVNGTVWRSDMQLTNPDSVEHTWDITYLPSRQSTINGSVAKTTVAAQSSVRYDDLLSWLYSGRLTDADKTSGVVEITPADGTSVYPIVQARSFNQTATGTFGQNIPPITPDLGVAAGQGKRLLLTGMSSQDIARTNLGFVNLSDTSSVNFAVVFYDENGNVLNPVDDQKIPIAYTFSLGVGGWDQDKLENRFHNAGWPALPAGLRAISAVIQVTAGGPGTVYATVIDNVTGDPNFILAQAAPQPAP